MGLRKTLAGIRESYVAKKKAKADASLEKYLLSLHKAGKLRSARRTLLGELVENGEIHADRVKELASHHLQEGGLNELGFFNPHPVIAFIYPFSEDRFKSTILLKYMVERKEYGGMPIVAFPDNDKLVRFEKGINKAVIRKVLDKIEKEK